MGSDIRVVCPKCKSTDDIKNLSQIYLHYQNKEAVKKFFGAEVCEIPDYLKDSDLDILEREDEYELTRGEMPIGDDSTMQDGSEFSGYSGFDSSAYVPVKREEQKINIYNIAPPQEPRIVKIPVAAMVLMVAGTFFIAVVLAAYLTGFDSFNNAILATLGLGLLAITAVIFAGVFFRNNRLLKEYEASRKIWKRKVVCSRCREIFIPREMPS